MWGGIDGLIEISGGHVGNGSDDVGRVAVAKYRMVIIEVGDRFFEDEELASSGIGFAFIAHGEDALAIMAQILGEFVGDGIAGAAVTMSAAVAGLDKEIGYDAMKFDPVEVGRARDIVSGGGIDEGFESAGKPHKIGHRDRRFVGEEFAINGSLAGLDRDHQGAVAVDFFGISIQRRGFRGFIGCFRGIRRQVFVDGIGSGRLLGLRGRMIIGRGGALFSTLPRITADGCGDEQHSGEKRGEVPSMS